MTQTLTTAETFRRALDAQRLDIHTALPGIVRSYDPGSQTAEIELALTRSVPASDEEDEEDTFEDLPVLPSVPVCWPRGGGFYLHFPLSAGDSVLVVFPEQDMNSWRNSGAVSDPSVGLRHSLGSAVAIPGLFPRTNTEPDADGTQGRIGRSGGSKIEIRTDDQIHVAGTSALAVQSEVAAEFVKIKTTLDSLSGATFATPYTGHSTNGTTKLKGS